MTSHKTESLAFASVAFVYDLAFIVCAGWGFTPNAWVGLVAVNCASAFCAWQTGKQPKGVHDPVLVGGAYTALTLYVGIALALGLLSSLTSVVPWQLQLIAQLVAALACISLSFAHAHNAPKVQQHTDREAIASQFVQSMRSYVQRLLDESRGTPMRPTVEKVRNAVINSPVALDPDVRELEESAANGLELMYGDLRDNDSDSMEEHAREVIEALNERARRLSLSHGTRG